MKKIILIALLATAALTFHNCKPTTPDTPPIIKDTTSTKPQPVNTFKLGLDTYKLSWDSIGMQGVYKSSAASTTIDVAGYDGVKYAEFKLIFPNKALGTFKHSTQPGDVVITIVTQKTSSPTTRKKYVLHSDAGSDMIITITKYDPVGGRIKGTFSGKMAEEGGITTALISNASFEVKRAADQ